MACVTTTGIPLDVLDNVLHLMQERAEYGFLCLQPGVQVNPVAVLATAQMFAQVCKGDVRLA